MDEQIANDAQFLTNQLSKLTCTCRYPYIRMLRHMVHKFFQSCQATRFTNLYIENQDKKRYYQSAMKSNRHHFRCPFASFFQEYIECVLEVLKEPVWRRESRRDTESGDTIIIKNTLLHVILIKSIRDN